MKNTYFLWLLFLFVGCFSSQEEQTEDLSKPQKTQIFVVDAKNEATIIGTNGTLLYIPQGAFLCGDKVVENGAVTVELVEALDGNSLIENNLATLTVKGEFLETVGMLYVNATKAGCSKLDFNPKKSPIAKIPSNALKADIQVFEGKQAKGVIVWDNPRPTENKPTLVPLKNLDFYNRKMKKKRDGLMNNLSTESRPIQKILTQDFDHSEDDFVFCGLDNEVVKILYRSEFEGTLISTLEFEQRMKFIHRTCSQELLNIYIENLDKNLWEIDLLAANYLESWKNAQATTFKAFARLKLTRPDNVSPISTKDVRAAIAKAEERQKELQKEAELLTIHYTISLTSMGWINCDKFLGQNNTIVAELNLKLSNVAAGAKNSAFLVFSSINSLLTLKSDSTGNFSLKNGYNPKGMNVPKDEVVLLVATSISADNIPSTATKTLTLGKDIDINLKMEPKTLEEYKKLIHEFFKPKEQDKVATDYNNICCGRYME